MCGTHQDTFVVHQLKVSKSYKNGYTHTQHTHTHNVQFQVLNIQKQLQILPNKLKVHTKKADFSLATLLAFLAG
jgi:hypothetical protein